MGSSEIMDADTARRALLIQVVQLSRGCAVPSGCAGAAVSWKNTVFGRSI